MDAHKFSPLWGEWYLTKSLGQGSYGKVYLSEKSEFGKKYQAAIKHLSIPPENQSVEDLYADGIVTSEESAREYYSQVLQTLTSEINVNYTLKGNTNIVSYEEHKIIPKQNGIGFDIFIKMELLTSLPDYIKQNGLTLEDVLKIGIDMTRALTVLEQEGIVHRDIKPANIFVNDRGDFKLGDFGVAKTIEKTISEMSVKGTYAFMAPEVKRGDKGNHTVDIYSLGIVLYRLTNENRAPFLPALPNSVTQDEYQLAQAKRFAGEILPAPRLAEDVFTYIILKACSFSPENRWRNAADMQQIILDYRKQVSEEGLKSLLILPRTENVQRSNVFSNVIFEDSVSEKEAVEIPVSESFVDDEVSPAILEETFAILEETLLEAQEETVLEPQVDTVFAVLEDNIPDMPEENIFHEPTNDKPNISIPPAPIIPSSEKSDKAAFVLISRFKSYFESLKVSKKNILLGCGVALLLLIPISLIAILNNANAQSHYKAALPDAPTPVFSHSSAPDPGSELQDNDSLFSDIDFADALIEKVLVELLEDKGFETLESALYSVENLSLKYAEVGALTTISDLLILPNLTALYLEGQTDIDLSVLAQMEAVSVLNVASCNLPGTSFLLDMPQLERLSLSGNDLSDISDLAALANLTHLDLRANNIENLSAISTLDNLEMLYVDENPISNWATVSHLQNVSGRPEDWDKKETPVGVSTPTPTPQAPTDTPAATPQPEVTLITISRTSAVLDVGGSVSLTAATLSPSGGAVPVTWSSSNSAVARVDSNGNVTAVGSGTAIITVSGGGSSISCTITVG